MKNNIELPFRSHYATIEGKQMHYLDEGKGAPLVIVHGIPEWSMVYAELVARLSPGYRCIVPDHLGFGLSAKDRHIALTPAAHAKRLVDFIEGLGIRDVNLLVHDYGGPIGIGALTKQPGLFKSVTITNSWLWDLEHTAAGKGLKMMQGSIGKWLYLNYGFSVKFMAKSGFADKKVFEQARPVFMAAHNTPDDRFANYQLMLAMLTSGAWFDETLNKLKDLHVPGQLVWGMKDRFFNDQFLNRWTKELPGYRIAHLPNAGHFPQLEAPELLAMQLHNFISSIKAVEV